MACRQYFSWLILAFVAVLPAGAQTVVRAGIMGPAWTAGMSCPTGQYVTASPDNLHVFRAINSVAGTAGATQPSWNLLAQSITTDGSCQWAEWGTSGSTGNSGGGGSGSTPQTLANCTATGGMVAMLGFQFATQTVGGVSQLCGTLATASSTVVEGICQSACGPTGTATVVYNGVTAGILDGTGQANDYVIPSSTPGYFTDVGLSRPSGTTETVGIVALPNSGGNGTAAQIFVSPLSLFAPGSSTGSGTINSGPQFHIPFYSSPGSGTVISPDTGCTTDGTGDPTCHSMATNGAGTGVWTPAVGSKPAAPSSGNASMFPVTSGSYGHAACENANGTSCLTQPEFDAFDYGCKEDGSTDDTACANALITAASTNQVAAIWYGVSSFASNVTFPTNIAIHFSTNGGFKPATSTITTIEGDVIATPHQQIFFNANSGVTGTIDFTGNTALKEVFPEWWGAVASGGTAATNTVAIQNAVYGAFGCGPVISCRTNASGNFKWNKILSLNGTYAINAQINLYHVISFRIECNGRNHAGINQTAANTQIFDGQSVAYGVFNNCFWETNASQDLSHPLISLDYNTSQGTDLATQSIDFFNNNWNGNSGAKIGFQLSRSGGGAQGSNIHFYSNNAIGFTEAAYMIGAGSGGTATQIASNAIEIQWIGGDIQTSPTYGIENFGGGSLKIDGTTFENGFTTQTGYDIWTSQSSAGEWTVVNNVRSESRRLVGSTTDVTVKDSFVIDQATQFVPGQSLAVGTPIEGSTFGGDGVWYKISVQGAFGGLGTIASPRTASAGGATTITDSVGGLTVNAYVGYQVTIVGGTGSYQYCVVTSNSASVITCTAGWKTKFSYARYTTGFAAATISNPDNTSQFIIEPNWGSQTTSGGATWTTMGEEWVDGFILADNLFVPGEQMSFDYRSKIINSRFTRSDWNDSGNGLAVFASGSIVHLQNDLVVDQNNSNMSYRTWTMPHPDVFTGIPGYNFDFKGAVPVCWGDGTSSPGAATKDDICFGINGTGTLTLNNNSSGSSKNTTFAQDGSLSIPGNFAFTAGKGQHVKTQAANNDLAGTVGVASSTTASVTFTTNYTGTPVCVLTPQTSGLTSWYLSAISNSGFTVTVAPSGTYTFGYICVGNPN